MAVIDPIEEITKALDGKKNIAGIFIDFIDTMNPKIVLEILEQYGIRGMARKWIQTKFNWKN